jgi:Radical SAM superfamily
VLSGIHFLLTYKCTSECDHCFLYCGPHRDGTFTVEQLRQVFVEIKKLGTIREVYFEGGEPFLFYPILLAGLQMAHQAGYDRGIVTNAYWATSIADAQRWLAPLRELGVSDLSVSDDDFHRDKSGPNRAEIALQAARDLGIPCSPICIQAPSVGPSDDPQRKGMPVIGGSVLFKGRAAEKLTAGLPVRPRGGFTTCPHEELAEPERVHLDVYGNVHLCQGLSVGNFWKTPLAELLRSYDGSRHPIAGRLLAGGPARLVEEFLPELQGEFVDECHLCHTARKALVPRFPEYLAPPEVYGI